MVFDEYPGSLSWGRGTEVTVLTREKSRQGWDVVGKDAAIMLECIDQKQSPDERHPSPVDSRFCHKRYVAPQRVPPLNRPSADPIRPGPRSPNRRNQPWLSNRPGRFIPRDSCTDIISVHCLVVKECFGRR